MVALLYDGLQHTRADAKVQSSLLALFLERVTHAQVGVMQRQEAHLQSNMCVVRTTYSGNYLSTTYTHIYIFLHRENTIRMV